MPSVRSATCHGQNIRTVGRRELGRAPGGWAGGGRPLDVAESSGRRNFARTGGHSPRCRRPPTGGTRPRGAQCHLGGGSILTGSIARGSQAPRGIYASGGPGGHGPAGPLALWHVGSQATPICRRNFAAAVPLRSAATPRIAHLSVTIVSWTRRFGGKRSAAAGTARSRIKPSPTIVTWPPQVQQESPPPTGRDDGSEANKAVTPITSAGPFYRRCRLLACNSTWSPQNTHSSFRLIAVLRDGSIRCSVHRGGGTGRDCHPSVVPMQPSPRWATACECRCHA